MASSIRLFARNVYNNLNCCFSIILEGLFQWQIMDQTQMQASFLYPMHLNHIWISNTPFLESKSQYYFYYSHLAKSLESVMVTWKVFPFFINRSLVSTQCTLWKGFSAPVSNLNHLALFGRYSYSKKVLINAYGSKYNLPSLKNW